MADGRSGPHRKRHAMVAMLGLPSILITPVLAIAVRRNADRRDPPSPSVRTTQLEILPMTDLSGPINWNPRHGRYRFHIRTAQGLQVDHIVIHGRDQEEAQRKLGQMYYRAQIIGCEELPDAQRLPGSGPLLRTLGR
jgi:hypothetical protein